MTTIKAESTQEIMDRMGTDATEADAEAMRGELLRRIAEGSLRLDRTLGEHEVDQISDVQWMDALRSALA